MALEEYRNVPLPIFELKKWIITSDRCQIFDRVPAQSSLSTKFASSENADFQFVWIVEIYNIAVWKKYKMNGKYKNKLSMFRFVSFFKLLYTKLTICSCIDFDTSCTNVAFYGLVTYWVSVWFGYGLSLIWVWFACIVVFFRSCDSRTT